MAAEWLVVSDEPRHFVNRMLSEAKERYWRGQVPGSQSSGLGIRAYCWQHQLSEPNFHA